MKFHKKLLTLSLAAALMTGCKKLDLAPSDRFSELTFWTIDANVNNALNNNYSLMYNSNLYFYHEALSDNAYSGAGDIGVIASGVYTSSLPKFQGDWSYYYRTIKSCNLFLQNVDQNKSLSPEVLSRMKGEVRFIRAFEHFNLAKWFGDVPLADHDLSVEETQQMQRSPRATVIQFVVSELEAAAALLPAKEQYTEADNGRITKAAALALEARVLLYEGDKMNEVVTICEKLMNDQNTYGQYGLVTNYKDLFNNPEVNKRNIETMLALTYVPSVRTWNEFFDFAPRSVGARTNNMAPTQELVDNYLMLNGKSINEAGSGYNENDPYVNRDPRLTATVVYDRFNWINPDGSTKIIYIKPGSDPDRSALDEYSLNGQGSRTGYYWRKYFDPIALASFTSGSNLHLIRYAEILLTYAEAKNSLGQMDATVWDKTIGALRARAGFTDAAALSYPGTAGMTDIIRQERRSEFAMEGLRIDDIRRWKIAEDVLSGYVHGAKFGDPNIDNGYIRVASRQFDPTKNYLWPIPPADISLNPNLTQNPGY